MDLSNLKPAKGSIKAGQRLGRGQGSTKGGTAGRGHKGQKSRSGYSKKFGFEGGQQPLQTRVPKFGFRNINRIEYKGINLDTLQALADNKKVTKIDPVVLAENSLVNKKDLVKILGRGEIKTKLEIIAHGFSQSAKNAIEKAGGKVVELPGKHADRKAKNEMKAAKMAKAKPKTVGKKKEKETIIENPKVKEKQKPELKEETNNLVASKEEKTKELTEKPDESNGKGNEETVAEEKLTK